MEYESIPLSVPNFSGNEQKYVDQAIKEEWVSTGGTFISNFETEVAKYVGAHSAVACQSGTAGLHLALLVGNIGYEQEVIVPTLTFIAAVNPVRYVNAEPVFMDCDDTLCMDMDKLICFCEQECEFKDQKLWNKATHRHVAAVIVVHVFGNLARMEILMNLAQKYNLYVIEDATEALGSRYLNGVYEGKTAGTIGDVGVYSFNGNKIITTGGGGMVVSNNSELLGKVRYLSTQAKNDTLYFVHNEVGYNYRMTNLQAALGLAQIEQLENFIDTKIQNYFEYQRCGIPLLQFREDIRSNHWFYSVMTNQRDELIRHLEKHSIQTRPIWHLIHDLPPYRGYQAYRIERAQYYWERIVNVPCSTNLSAADVATVAECILRFG